MDRSIFDEAGITTERLDRAVHALTDREWAEHCMEAGLAQIRSGQVSFWVPRLTLLAALRLDRAAEFLPHYEQFLLLLDGVSKVDWHRRMSEAAASGNLLQQSGRFGQTRDEFEAEFQRLVEALGPPDGSLVADIGCGGGLWAIRLAKLGYRVIGTERHDFLVEAARKNAADASVDGLVEFRVDDICASTLAPGLCPRALCVLVTPTLSDDAAFDSLVHHLDRITRNGGAGQRCVMLGGNRWGPSRMTAVEEILDAAEENREGVPWPLSIAERYLYLVEIAWWLQPHHLEAIRQLFPSIEQLGESHERRAGKYVDLVLR